MLACLAGGTREKWPMLRPAYACALVLHGRHVLLEDRPLGSAQAANRLTCFGGKREGAESPWLALCREMHEELAVGIMPQHRHVDLWRHDWWIARFYMVSLIGQPCCHSGHRALWWPIAGLESPRVSAWHRAVFAAWRSGRRVAQVP